MTNDGARDCRCACKKLLARATTEGVEIKCGRCERLVVVTWPEGRVIERSTASSDRAPAASVERARRR